MLALTMGDPAGIGGELTVQLLHRTPHPFVVLDDPARLAAYARAPIQAVTTVAEARTVFPHAIPVIPIPLVVPAIAGHPSAANAPAVLASIQAAVHLVQTRQADAVVTNPISKATLYEAGFTHPGHTEFLAALTNTPLPVMMLAAPALRVVPVTVHLSLRAALDRLDTELIVAIARITHAALIEDFGIPAPRLAIAGLNPHAGEGGALGTEETTLITPAIHTLRAEGIDATGPWPPDTLFTPDARSRYDAALCMYHDQALIPLKTLDRDHGVNVTLGLPIIRTSPDHGTAFDIAGSNTANPTSLLAAMALAAELAGRRKAAKARPGLCPGPAGVRGPQTP